MNLDRATNPQEAKRNLKNQVFLAIQGKYMPGKTTELINDINTIAADILGDEAKELLPCVDPKPQTKLFDEVMFHCVDGDYYKPVEVDQIGTPVSEELMLNSTVYYRHKVGLIDDDNYVIYWFYSHMKDLSGWVFAVKYELWTKLRAHAHRDKPAQDLTAEQASEIRKATSQAIMDQSYNADDDKACAQSEGVHTSAGDKPKTIPKSAPHIFIGGGYDGQTRDFNLDDMGMPTVEKIKMNTVNVGSELYYRHSIITTINGFSVTRWFYLNQEEPNSWTKENVTEILDRINKFFDQPQAAYGHKDILCIGGDVDGKAIYVPCGRIGKPLQKAIYPMNGIQKYYLHSLTVGFDRTAKTYYFYSPKQEYTDLLPRSAATALDLLIEFYKDKKED